jgi:hypothetical protein
MPTNSVSPVRDEAGSRSTMGRPRQRRLGAVVIAVGAVLVIAAGLTAFVVSRSDHPGGDTGGVVLRELSTVPLAVPSGATITSSRKSDAAWSPACPANTYGRAGWSGVEVSTNFKSADSAQSIVSAVGSVLTTQGWRSTLPVAEAAWQYTPLAEWTKSLPGTTSAKIVVFRYPQNGSPSPTAASAWMLGAEGKTPGYALPGC